MALAAVTAVVLATAGNAAAATTIPLGAAADFGVLASTAITNTGTTTVTGDIGASSGSMTGTGATGADSITLTGSSADRGNDTATAQIALTAAYTAAGLQGNGTVVGPTNLALQTQPMLPGVYSSGSDLALTGRITLDGAGSYDSVFVFRAGAALTTAAASRVSLVNGAQACNVFWQIGSSATLGAGSRFAGNVLATTSITLLAGVTVDGRLLARTGAVTMISDTITRSTCRTGLVAGAPATTTPATTTPSATTSPGTATTPAATPSASAAPTSASRPTATTAPAPTGGARASSGSAGTTRSGPARAGDVATGLTTYDQVGQVPVGSVDTGDGSTAG